jgi:hypothetical protein
LADFNIRRFDLFSKVPDHARTATLLVSFPEAGGVLKASL